jgi:site-specific DNA recombinase
VKRRAPNLSAPSNSAVAYVRVSTEEQAIEGVSLEAQQEKIRAYCTMRNLDLVDMVIDAGVSAGKPLASRNGGAQVLDAVRRRKAGAIVALKLDRLFRNCADCLNVIEGWDKAGIALHLVDLGGQAVDTSSAMGRFFITVMAGAAELERNQVRERTSMAMRHKAARGEYIGGHAPLGHRLQEDGTLAAVDVEQEALALARELHGRGLSLREVSKALAEGGHVNRKGKPFHSQQVSRMVSAAA